jgi:hypothetical protein
VDDELQEEFLDALQDTAALDTSEYTPVHVRKAYITMLARRHARHHATSATLTIPAWKRTATLPSYHQNVARPRAPTGSEPSLRRSTAGKAVPSDRPPLDLMRFRRRLESCTFSEHRNPTPLVVVKQEEVHDAQPPAYNPSHSNSHDSRAATPIRSAMHHSSTFPTADADCVFRAPLIKHEFAPVASSSRAKSLKPSIHTSPFRKGKTTSPVRPDQILHVNHSETAPRCRACQEGILPKRGWEHLLPCAQCKGCWHRSCLNLPAEVFRVCTTYDWKCQQCATCLICHKKRPYQAEGDTCLLCEGCDRPYHDDCLDPPLVLKEMPPGCAFLSFSDNLGLTTVEAVWKCEICVRADAEHAAKAAAARAAKASKKRRLSSIQRDASVPQQFSVKPEPTAGELNTTAHDLSPEIAMPRSAKKRKVPAIVDSDEDRYHSAQAATPPIPSREGTSTTHPDLLEALFSSIDPSNVQSLTRPVPASPPEITNRFEEVPSDEPVPNSELFRFASRG